MSQFKTTTTLPSARPELEVVVRTAQRRDLERINRVIARAIDSWRITERVKRICLPLYQYQADDLDFFQVFVAENQHGDLLGVAATEDGESADGRAGPAVINLHGIYVDPTYHGRGAGSCLMQKVEQIASIQGYSALLVKAKADATGFFARLNFDKLPIRDPDRDYPYRYRKPLASRDTRQGSANR
jgi:N-acetylglutamate synthase-like GNAT family acetyltransferase